MTRRPPTRSPVLPVRSKLSVAYALPPIAAPSAPALRPLAILRSECHRRRRERRGFAADFGGDRARLARDCGIWAGRDSQRAPPGIREVRGGDDRANQCIEPVGLKR